MRAANRLRQSIAEKLSVTISGGLAVYPSDGSDWDRLFAVADERLYAAKHGGRDRVEGPPRPSIAAATATG